MNIFSLFKKRNYIFLYQKIKFYEKSVKNVAGDYSSDSSLQVLMDYFEINKYDKIVVVASGPSASKLILEENALYISCNDSIHIVESKPHIYTVHDPFYLVKYLKSFKPEQRWLGTIFWIYNNKSKINAISFKKTFRYITRKSRERKEYLITDFKYTSQSQALNSELIKTLKKEFDFKYQSINSGFNALLIASVFALKSNKSLEIYGLDMGMGGDEYYNKKAVIGKSIKGDNNRKIVGNFLLALYQKQLKVTNASNFMTNGL